MNNKRPIKPDAVVYHITTQSGHVARTRRKEVGDHVIEYLRPFVREGGGFVEQLGLWLHLEPVGEGAVAYQLTRAPAAEGGHAAVVGAMCWRRRDSEQAWEAAREMARKSHVSLHTMPPDNPRWLTASLGPDIVLLGPAVSGSLGDFERCLYWTAVHYWEPPEQ